jgi:hypothetical protein
MVDDKPNDVDERLLCEGGYLDAADAVIKIVDQERDTFARALRLAVPSFDLREAHIWQAERQLLEESCASS